MREARVLGMAGTVLALLVAGCVSGPVGPPVSTATVPQDAPQEGGEGNYNLTLKILDEPGGPPIQQAAIIVYWGSFDGESSGSFEISGSADGGSGGGSADGVVRVDVRPDTPEPETTVPLRTGPDGMATARVPANQVVGVVASATGHTEEWVPRAVTGDDGGRGVVDFPVYKASVTDTLNDTLGPAGASPGRVTGSNFDWSPQEVPWGSNAAARQGYVERLASWRLTLTWENGPNGAGDLSIGAGDTSSGPDFVQEQDNPQGGPGEQTEQAALTKTQVDDFGWPVSETLYVGPATSTAYASPMGLPYELTSEARFDPFAQPTGGPGSENQSPTLGSGALVALVGLTAVLIRRRGPR